MEGSRSPLVCGCGKSVPGAGLSQDAAGDASGAKSRRVETGPTLALNVLTAASWAFLPPLPLPSSPAPGHDPAGLSVSRNTWPFPELRRLNSCSPPRLPTAAVPSAWLFTGQQHSPFISRQFSFKTLARLLGRTFPEERTGQLRVRGIAITHSVGGH